MPYNFVADSFTQRNFVAYFLQTKCDFTPKTAVLRLEQFSTLCVFEPFFGDLGATYDDHLRLIGNRVVDFLLVLIDFFR